MSIPIVERAGAFTTRRAIVATEGTFTYGDLLAASERGASELLGGADDLDGARVVFLVPGGFQYVAMQWAIWRAGGVAVPLALSETEREIRYKIDDTEPAALITHPDFANTLRPLAEEGDTRFFITTELLGGDRTASLPDVDPERAAMILYTSGTTSDPKGVVATHRNVEAQVVSLVEAWGWSSDDRILNHLPLHHVHGIINALSCALWVGATCELLPRFDAERLWSRISDRELTLYMTVPTVYKALIAAWESGSREWQMEASAACSNMRLMVSGSDALPVDTFERWQEISGHGLLERYGMTEIGMALSNPLHGDRIPGHVGAPLPGVEVRLADLDLALFEETGERRYGESVVGPNSPGELQVRGSGVFQEYWRKPDATREAFTDDGWFFTGDIASVNEDGMYRIWGRASQDLIISGGENVSALEVQRELLMHPEIDSCAVVGVKDPFWGKAVSAAVITRNGSGLDRDALREWAKGRLAPYKAPQRVIFVNDLPRNAMGKIVKPKVRDLFKEATN
ncbi:MAG: acyl-CoA synthetase [Chloroflexi bacterium]|nr:acyl-CoA synthetase [Chloroflexota bacterium]